MAQLDLTPVYDGSQFMRPFAIGMTAYLVGYYLLYMITRGALHSPDTVSDVYFFVLATYAGAPEIKRWTSRQEDDPQGFQERIRKGGPLITLWFFLWSGAVLWRIYDPNVPMPPELKTITLQIMGLFFGTYALRQMRKRSVRSLVSENEENDSSAANQLLNYLKEKGPATPKTIREALGLPRRTLTRLLTVLVDQGRLERSNDPPQDPSATYRARD